jgi:hypothetical protein
MNSAWFCLNGYAAWYSKLKSFYIYRFIILNILFYAYWLIQGYCGSPLHECIWNLISSRTKSDGLFYFVQVTLRRTSNSILKNQVVAVVFHSLLVGSRVGGLCCNIYITGFNKCKWFVFMCVCVHMCVHLCELCCCIFWWSQQCTLSYVHRDL